MGRPAMQAGMRDRIGRIHKPTRRYKGSMNAAESGRARRIATPIESRLAPLSSVTPWQILFVTFVTFVTFVVENRPSHRCRWA
jgi:hypothetical protein